MKRKLKNRLRLLGIMGACLLALAAAPRPARPAVPARPAQQTETGPLSGRVILVDAGHGGTDGGARAKDSGVWEKEINLQVASLVKKLLTDGGANVIMTREEDTQYSENKRADLTARLELAKTHRADMILSIHMNEYRSRREAGPQVFYREGQEQSRLLAGTLQDALNRELQPRKKRSALAGNYFILSLNLPSALVECGFLSNREEEALLLTDGYRQRVAQAIYDGVTEYFLLTQGSVSSVSAK